MARLNKEAIGTAKVAARLRVTRVALKLTQAALCRNTGISTAAWNNYETGDSRIGLDAAIKLCDATGVTLDWLYRGLMSSGLPNEIREAIIELERQQRRTA